MLIAHAILGAFYAMGIASASSVSRVNNYETIANCLSRPSGEFITMVSQLN